MYPFTVYFTFAWLFFVSLIGCWSSFMIHDKLWVRVTVQGFSKKQLSLCVGSKQISALFLAVFFLFLFFFFVQHHLALKRLTILVATMCTTVSGTLSDCKLFLNFSRIARVYADGWNWVSQIHVVQLKYKKFNVQNVELFLCTHS